MKVLFCGASGYGNLGDDGYRLVFSEQLGDRHETLFDSPYPDMRAVDWADVVVIGGGGLIYCNESSHFEYMSMYMDRALEQGKPLAFVSCGVQIRFPSPNATPPLDEMISWGLRDISRWRRYLEAAAFVTVRSPTCERILREVAPGQDRIRFYPDACYLLRPPSWQLCLPRSNVFIPTTLGVRKRGFKAMWKKVTVKEPEIPIVAALFAQDDIAGVDEISRRVTEHANLATRKNLSPQDGMAIVARAHRVVTNRYHGAIFARAAGVPEARIEVVDSRYKSYVEEPPEDLGLARGHIEELLRLLEEHSGGGDEVHTPQDRSPAPTGA